MRIARFTFRSRYRSLSGPRHPAIAFTVALTAGAIAMLGVQAPAAQAQTRMATARASASAKPAAAKFVKACGTPKPGHATCFALRRTNVSPVKGLITATAPDGFGAQDLESAYSLPTDGGAGQTVAIVDAQDDPTAEADLAVYRQQFGLPACTAASGCFTKVNQRGGTDYPAPDPGWAGEISLDLDMVSATAPRAHILLVEADSTSLDDLGAAVDEAVALGAKYVSNSYGSNYNSTPGSGELPQDVASDADYNHPGVAVVASSGDSGYGVSYPAASPYVTSVGGTSLVRDPGTQRGWSESVWFDPSVTAGPGSGCSLYEPKPALQTASGCDHRAVADVSADADPATGVAVYQTFGNDGWAVYGGTSAAAPVVTGTYAAAGTPDPGTYPNTYPYLAGGAGLNDVTSGSNGTCSPASLCTAGPGYDGPTGLGTPSGLTAFRDSPHGDLSGRVTSASTGAAVPGVKVAVGSYVTQTDADGRYHADVPVGTYDVTADGFGYLIEKAPGVKLADGTSVTKDFALPVAPSRRVSGKVTDGSGQGWPLYAKISVDGVPFAPIWTDPYTGAYQVNLPEGHTYTLHVSTAYPGYQAVTRTLDVGHSGVKRDIAVPADPWSGTTPGYAIKDTGTTEGFDSSTAAPAGWSVINAPGTTGGWAFNDPGAQGNNTGGSGSFAIEDALNAGTPQDSSLITPAYDFSQDDNPGLSFRTDAIIEPQQQATVDASTDDGATWATVWSAGTFLADHPGSNLLGPQKITVPLTAFAHDPTVRFRFHYASAFGLWWAVDDVFAGNRSLQTVPDALIAGSVTDANTGNGLNSADLSSTSGSGLTTASNATPDDPGLQDGFYWTFAPPGTYSVTAVKKPYSPLTEKIVARSGRVTKTAFALKVGQLHVSPASVSATVGSGGQTVATVTVKNTGGAPATLTLAERPGGLPTATQGAPLSRTKGDFSPLLSRPATPDAQRAEGTRATADQPSGSAWQSAPDTPEPSRGGIADSYGGKIYEGLGENPAGKSRRLFAFDPKTGTWTTLAPLGNARLAPAHGFINGKLYIAGGIAEFQLTPDPAVNIYDPASDSWTQGANDPEPLVSPGTAVLNGKLYSVGGCTFFHCGSTAVTVYDPSTDSWSTAADYPVPAAWLSCGAILGKLYCAGGTNDTTDLKSAYVYDPSSDSWSPLPDMPETTWGSAAAVSNGQLLVASGIVGGELSNQAFAYDPATVRWVTLPNVNQAAEESAGAPGFYKFGGLDANGLHLSTVEHLPGYDQPDSADVPWLSESTQRVTVQPGKSIKIQITLNGAATAASQPGSYTAQLVLNSSTPYQMAAIPVSLTVAKPSKRE